MNHLLQQPVALFRILLSFPFLFILPGYATLLLLQPSRIGEGLFISVLLSVLLISPVGLLLAEMGLFSLSTVCTLEAGANQDGRDLGVMLDWLEFATR